LIGEVADRGRAAAARHQNVINQIGTLSSHYQAVVAVQAYLSRAYLRGRR